MVLDSRTSSTINLLVEGKAETLQVRKFNEIKPNHITFKNMETEKQVVVKSDEPIKYIIREE